MRPGLEPSGEGAGGGELGVPEGVLERELDLRIRIGIRRPPAGRAGRLRRRDGSG